MLLILTCMNLTRSLILTSAVMLSLILLGEVFLLEVKRGGVDRTRDVRGAGGVAQGHTRRSLAWRLRIHLLVEMLISLVSLRPLSLVHLAGEGHQPLKTVADLVLPTPCLVPWSPGSGGRWTRVGSWVLQISRLVLQMSWWVLQDQARSWVLGVVVARWHLVRVT